MGSVVLAGATSGSTTITPSDTVTATVTLPSTGGTLQTSGAGFTTNGVAYASSTSALATGSALTFDGTNLGIGTSSPSAKLDIVVPTGTAKIKVGDGTVSGGAYLNLQGTSGTKTWFVASNYNVGGALEFIQSTANGGSTPAGTSSMLLDSSGNLLVGYTSSNGSYKLQVNSQIFATSAIIATSDARYKTNVTPISNGLALINKLNPVSFDW